MRSRVKPRVYRKSYSRFARGTGVGGGLVVGRFTLWLPLVLIIVTSLYFARSWSLSVQRHEQLESELRASEPLLEAARLEHRSVAELYGALSSGSADSALAIEILRRDLGWIEGDEIVILEPENLDLEGLGSGN